MFADLTALGYGIITFAIIIGVGIIVLSNFASTDTAKTTGANTSLLYLQNQLGSSGLAGWTPAIIAISVGLLFLGAFFVGGGRKRKR
jgi:hypothetical protein